MHQIDLKIACFSRLEWNYTYHNALHERETQSHRSQRGHGRTDSSDVALVCP